MGKLDDYHDHWTEKDDEYNREHPDDRNFLYDDEVEELERQRDEERQKEIEKEHFRD
jgi:hypothetical protein